MQADPQIPDEIRLFECVEGPGPLVIAAPHVGTHIPPDIAATMNATGLGVNETDFHVHRLFDFAAMFGASTLFATHSRYVVDLNRDPEGHSLYPGRFETPLLPVSDFDRNPIYEGIEPDDGEIVRRRAAYWQPYHDRLCQLLDAAIARHGRALLIDAHSIRPAIPNLFEGRLPALNFGLNDGRSASHILAGVINAWGIQQDRYSYVVDGRFKGGYTTRHYGHPENGVQAIQIEIVQDTYLNMATPHLYDEAIAMPLKTRLMPLVESLVGALLRT